MKDKRKLTDKEKENLEKLLTDCPFAIFKILSTKLQKMGLRLTMGVFK
jgi:hypothetical protein